MKKIEIDEGTVKKTLTDKGMREVKQAAELNDSRAFGLKAFVNA